MIQKLLGKGRVQAPIDLPELRSKNATGEGYIRLLEDGGFRVVPKARGILETKPYWPPLIRGQSFQPVIISDRVLGRKNTTTQAARAKAKELGLIEPSLELAPLLRLELSSGWMKQNELQRIAVLHPHIRGSAGYGEQPQNMYLGMHTFDGGNYIVAFADYPGFVWGKQVGFVFLRPLQQMRVAA